jgi:signal transduction histidine kinase
MDDFPPGGPPESDPGPEARLAEAPPPVDPDGLREALAGHAGHRTVAWQDESVRVYSVPIVREGKLVGAVQLAHELRDLDDLARNQIWTLVLFLPLAALAAGGAAVVLANRALRPVAQVTRAASQIGSADLSRRLEVVGDDELAELARTFNAMLGRLEGAFGDLGTANERLARALDAQRRFTADASHELRTPLTRLRLAADAGKDPTADEAKLRDSLAVAARASGSMARLVDQLLTLARVDAGQLPVRRERFDARIAVAEALDGIPGSDRVEATFPDRPVPVDADPDHVRRIVTNLVENALRHTPAPRRVFASLSTDGGYLTFEVRDEGEGIPPEHLERVFERFHRVDASRTGGGSGLGLAICRDLVHANGGDIRLQSRPGVGTRALVRLPLASPL